VENFKSIFYTEQLNHDNRIGCLDINSPLYLRTNNDKSSCGDISDMYLLVDRSAQAGFHLIQFTPIQDTVNPSPFMGISLFSFNPIFLDTRSLGIERRLRHNRPNIVDYRGSVRQKRQILKRLYESQHPDIKIPLYDRQIVAYAVFKVLKNRFKRAWVNWPGIFSSGDVDRILAKHQGLYERVKFELFIQDIMAKQWKDLANYARKKGIRFVMDKPIYPIYDSAEVWANQGLFYLNPDGTLKCESGCDNPRDPFGRQKWGHAVFRFKEKPEEVVAYYIESIRHLVSISPVVRFDHALALSWKYYLIDKKTDKGRHIEALKSCFFGPVRKAFPDVLFVADDLGHSSKKIDKLLRDHGVFGIRCLQWVHTTRHREIEKYPRLSIAATSTHDTDSLGAWWKKLSHDERRVYFKKMTISRRLRCKKIRISLDQMTKETISLMFNSRSQIATVGLRDLLGDLRRYNNPGHKNRTNWRIRSTVLIGEMDFSFIESIIKNSKRN
jgi:4-alpha-glucanotransferase